MNRFVLNSAVITAPGNYTYRLISVEEAKEWLQKDSFISAIGYEETAKLMTQLFGVEVPVSRTMVTMNAGDEALVFRLKTRVAPSEKGEINIKPEDAEIGLLRRIL